MARAFILGAGASKGSSLGAHAPPVLREFVERIWSTSINTNMFPRMLDFLKQRFGIQKDDLRSGAVNYEEALSLMDAEYLFVLDVRRDLDGAMEIHSNRGTLLGVAEDVLRGSSVYCHRGTCERHDRIASTLSAGDVIINFNYDIIMDASLRRMGLLSEEEPWAYGVPFTHSWDGRTFTRLRSPRRYLQRAFYFKLHGAVNWFRGTGYVEQRFDAKRKKWRVFVPSECLDRQTMPVTGLLRSDRGAVGVEPILIPPSFMKANLMSDGRHDWAKMWRECSKKLGACRNWVIIGFSCGHSDLDARWLLRRAATACGGPTISIVDLSPDAVKTRLAEVLRGAPYEWGTSYTSLEAYVQSLPPIPASTSRGA
jgi:hypothetical protein